MFAHGHVASLCGFVSSFSCPLVLDFWVLSALAPTRRAGLDIFVGVLFERTLVMTSEGRSGPTSHGTCWREGGDRGSRLEPRAPAALRER